MDQPPLSPESNVALLLASHLGSDSDAEASDGGLGPVGWQEFAARVTDSSLDSPGALLNADTEELPDDIWTTKARREWVTRRLSRSTRLAMELEELNNRGIWVTTRYEDTYPTRLARTLGRKAPPFLYVAGEADHLDAPAVGFVGSRDADEADRDYTRRLVSKVTDGGYGVVSGGAKGIDEASEAAGLDRGGPVVEFPAEGLHHCLQDDTVREAVVDGRLTLASHYHPRASWNVGAAMGRNKLIHGFGNYTVVVRSGNETGGTWEGATENLRHGWSPLLVCSHDETPAGNDALVERGGVPIDPTAIPSDASFESWVRARRAEQSAAGDDSGTGEAGGASAVSDDRQSSLDQFD